MESKLEAVGEDEAAGAPPLLAKDSDGAVGKMQQGASRASMLQVLFVHGRSCNDSLNCLEL